ncbi:hypothetical protein DEF23_14975 [Marinitenerispora sediminis]|uniref:Uncharacterized protein n=1 Tax=Marinitenerispora sediminis TaxID=1931232 RepID=A0A368TB48_9ACTN|nr:hypothetical protein DEF28_17140 [Marinitenerispora sediminis]RCV55042.1 hypothetical protein DEF23_14975 [Marinitenerispora sediminis]RCV62089.1 hypothetical protein DEF24_02590 [Marinitenerispora sediminis]
MRRGRVKGPLGSIERPASPLHFRLVLAVFGALVCLVGAVLAVTWAHSAALTVVLAAGVVATGLNIYWVSQRIRHER